MRFFCFHLMPWVHLPEDFAERYDSAWVTCPNTLYDPQLGHPLYNRYLDELELADQLGFEGICVNEHHQNAYGNMPSPNIMAACLARRTTQAKLAILGNVLPLYDHPQRVAEELAMLDVITQGRIISGMVVGTGMEYFSYNINPTYARERFHEAHFWYYARNLLKTPAPLRLPPGHTSLPTMLTMTERRLRSRPGNLNTWEEVERGSYVVVGSPETVRQRLEDYAKRVGFGLLVANFSVGNVPTELTRKSMTLFAQEVMPRLKHVNSDAPVAAGAVA